MARPRWVTEPESMFAQIDDDFLLEGRVLNATTGTPLAPTSATVEIKRRGGGTLVASTAATVSGEWVSYTLAADSMTAPERYLSATFAILISGTTHRVRHFFDAVRVKPTITADVSEVAIGAPGLEYLATQEDPSAQEVLREAWEHVLEWLRAVAGYPDLLIDQRVLRSGHILKTREMLYSRDARGPSHPSAHQATQNREAFEEWAKRAALALDRDRSGYIDPGEEPQSVAVVRVGRREATTGSVPQIPRG